MPITLDLPALLQEERLKQIMQMQLHDASKDDYSFGVPGMQQMDKKFMFGVPMMQGAQNIQQEQLPVIQQNLPVKEQMEEYVPPAISMISRDPSQYGAVDPNIMAQRVNQSQEERRSRLQQSMAAGLIGTILGSVLGKAGGISTAGMVQNALPGVDAMHGMLKNTIEQDAKDQDKYHGALKTYYDRLFSIDKENRDIEGKNATMNFNAWEAKQRYNNDAFYPSQPFQDDKGNYYHALTNRKTGDVRIVPFNVQGQLKPNTVKGQKTLGELTPAQQKEIAKAQTEKQRYEKLLFNQFGHNVDLDKVKNGEYSKQPDINDPQYENNARKYATDLNAWKLLDSYYKSYQYYYNLANEYDLDISDTKQPLDNANKYMPKQTAGNGNGKQKW